LTLRVENSNGAAIASLPLAQNRLWLARVPYAFTSTVRDAQAPVEFAATGRGTLLVGFIS
jgi:hypothetical protein